MIDRPLPSARAWRPSNGRRLALTVVVLGLAAALARVFPTRLSWSEAGISGAQEIAAYEMIEGRTARFVWPAGTDTLRVLTNLDLTGPPEARVPYGLSIRVPEDDRAETFFLTASEAREAAGTPAMYFLGDPARPARTRELVLTRNAKEAASLEVTLVEPVGGRASLRVLASHERVSGAPLRPSAVGAPRPIEGLAPDVQEMLASRGWSRLVAADALPARHFYMAGPGVREAAAAPGLDGELIGEGNVAAYLLKGPGTVDVVAASGALAGTASLMYASGAERRVSLSLPDGGRQSLALERGLATLRVSARAPCRVRLAAADPEMAAYGSQVRSPVEGDDGVAIRPAWSWQTLARVDPAGPPVTFDLVGRRGAPLRITARVPYGRAILANADVRLRWRIRDDAGATLDRGDIVVGAALAPEDRLEAFRDSRPDVRGDVPADGRANQAGAGAAAEADRTQLVSEPTAFLIWAPPAGARLELQSSSVVLVSAASPGFDPPVSRDGTAPGSQGLPILRYTHDERPLYYPVRAREEADLAAAGRLVSFRGAVRLEPRPVAAALGAAETLTPKAHDGRFALLAPAPVSDRGLAGSSGRLWSLPPDKEASISVYAPPGAGPGARLPANILFEVRNPRRPRVISFTVDGRPERDAPVHGPRGQVTFPLSAGPHRLRVALPGEGRIFINQRVVGARTYRTSAVFAFRRGLLRVPVHMGREARALGLVLYTDSPPPRGAPLEIEAIIDKGVRRRSLGPISRARTQLRIRYRLAFKRAEEASYLERANRHLWSSGVIFLLLGDDLGSGNHEVTLRVPGPHRNLLGRFFAYRGPRVSRMTEHLEVRTETWE